MRQDVCKVNNLNVHNKSVHVDLQGIIWKILSVFQIQDSY